MLKYIGYTQGGDTKSIKSKLIRRLFASIGELTSQVISIPTSVKMRYIDLILVIMKKGQ